MGIKLKIIQELFGLAKNLKIPVIRTKFDAILHSQANSI
jgi:hypothetical protein